MNPKRVADMLAELRVLPMFPNDEAVLIALARMAGAMAENEAQVRWLVSRMTSGIYAQWPGPAEMRACFCSKFKPKDGITTFSTVHLDGIPSERQSGAKQIAPPEYKALPPGDPVSADPEVVSEVKSSVGKLSRRWVERPPTKAEIAAAPAWLRRMEGYE